MRPTTCVRAMGLLLLTTATVAADVPKVVKLVPRNGATKVDPATTELRIKFNMDMDQSGHSLCGGGETFPTLVGRPEWIDPRTMVIKVKLQPGRDYELSINCPAAQNFRSVNGDPVKPTPWSFSTAGVRTLSVPEQEALNEESLRQLMLVLRKHYSYYKLRKIDWDALEAKHRRRIVAAEDTREWVAAAARMLAPAKDLHLWFKHRERTVPTYKRPVEPNFDLAGVKKVLPRLRQRNACVHTATTDDRLGYVLIGTLSADRRKELGEVPGFLREMKDCRGLIIDLRVNGGGDETLAWPIAAWFVQGDAIYSKNLIRDAKAPGGFSGPFDRVIRGNAAPDRYDGPVAVLIGPAVMSSAESFVLMLKQAEQAVLIGAPTRGSSGNPKPHELPNGVTVFVPSWQDMLPDGQVLEGRGVRPDMEVFAKPADFKDGDPVLERALAVLREKIKATRP